MIFCTLFDSNYLDKGIALIKSLNNLSICFKIYVLAMDEKCYTVLQDLNMKNTILIERREFICKERLEEMLHDRSNAEFCWTCSSHLIDYVLNEMKEDACTYLDADLYFYHDPSILLHEMGNSTVQIVEHRFTNRLQDQISMHESGRFCVEFNTFKNEEKSLELLQWWKKSCRESCSNVSGDSRVFGDQKYLEGWENYSYVSVLKNLGGGVAPWNVFQYKLVDKNNMVLLDKKSQTPFELIFYHFHNISYIDENTVDISVYQRAWGVDDGLIESVYIPYLKELRKIKVMLKEKYGLDLLVKKHPALNQKKEKDKNNGKHHSIECNLFQKLYLFIDAMLKNKLVAKKNIIEF